MALNKQCEHGFALVLLFNIVEGIGKNVRVSMLFLWGQSEKISISVKDDIRFGVFFPLSVITSNCNRIKISKVCFGKGFRCHSLIISLSQTVHARNHTKKLANMPAKRK
jgi:predicted nucleic acid binding AN1-type Zn finger protein